MDEMTVLVNKKELMDKVQTNRDNHREVFEDAMEGYRVAVVAALEDRLARINARKQVDLFIRLPEPEDHTADYDRVLAMLDMHTDSEIAINSSDFAQFVMDDWDWKRQWVASNSHYSAKVK